MDVSLCELWDLVMDREAWRAAIHGVTKCRTWLSDWTDWNDKRGFYYPTLGRFKYKKDFVIYSKLSIYLAIYLLAPYVFLYVCMQHNLKQCVYVCEGREETNAIKY